MVLDQRVTGTTILTGLIGNPVEHTVSPVLHNSLFSHLRLNGIYIPLMTEKGMLGTVINGLKALGFAGFNVTIPYKEEILGFLDEADDEVRLLGAANTVRIKDGRLYGYNTDGTGFVNAFTKQTGTDFRGRAVCILGAGGTARSLAVKITAEGAGRLCIINRTRSKAEEIASYINKTLISGKEAAMYAFTAIPGTGEAHRILNEFDIIINTTSAGMYPNTDMSPVGNDVDFLCKPIVYDVIYNPTETKLLSMARGKGCKTCNGAGMLLYQGIRAFEIWMETRISDTVSAELSTTFLKYLEV